MGRGFNNRNKKSDNFDDLLPTVKFEKSADTGEIFVDSHSKKLRFKRGVNDYSDLENTLVPPPVQNSDAIAAVIGFRLVGCIGQDITLEDDRNYEFTGPLQMCTGKVLTVPLGTTLTIV